MRAARPPVFHALAGLALGGMALAAHAQLQDTQGIAFENEFVRVTRNAAPCGPAGTVGCGERVLVAMGQMGLRVGGTERRASYGDILAFAAGETYQPEPGARFFEVMVKPGHPPARGPAEVIGAENNLPVHDSARFFIYEEKLPVGAIRTRHSHAQRIEIRMSQGPQLQQRIWREAGRDSPSIVNEAPIVNWREPMIHEVRNTGDQPLRNFILEFKPGR